MCGVVSMQFLRQKESRNRCYLKSLSSSSRLNLNAPILSIRKITNRAWVQNVKLSQLFRTSMRAKTSTLNAMSSFEPTYDVDLYKPQVVHSCKCSNAQAGSRYVQQISLVSSVITIAVNVNYQNVLSSLRYENCLRIIINLAYIVK